MMDSIQTDEGTDAVDLGLRAHELREAAAGGNALAIDRTWRRFEEDLARTLVLEEKASLPELEARAPREAEALRRSHLLLRRMADAVALRVELRIVRIAEIERLLAELRQQREQNARKLRAYTSWPRKAVSP